MGYDLHTVEVSSSSTARPRLDRLLMLVLNDYAFPASAAACTALGAITAGTGFTTLPALAPSGGTLTAGVSPADPAQAVATSLKVVSATINAPGTGVAINDTFNLTDGTLAVAGAYGNGTVTAGVNAVLTVSSAQLVNLAVNATGSSYAAGDTVTLAGGTSSVAAVITVDTVTAGAIATFHVSTPGTYTVETTTFTQSSTSGSGTGATFKTAVWGAKGLTASTAGGYTVPPTGNVWTNGTGSGTGLTFTPVIGLGTALLTHSGNYSSAPSFTVTGGGGTGASIATATLGGSGAAIPRTVSIDLPTPYNAGVMSNCQAIQNVTTLLKTNVGFTFSLTGATTLAAGTVDVVVIG